jgi:hypothetical protein
MSPANLDLVRSNRECGPVARVVWDEAAVTPGRQTNGQNRLRDSGRSGSPPSR